MRKGGNKFGGNKGGGSGGEGKGGEGPGGGGRHGARKGVDCASVTAYQIFVLFQSFEALQAELGRVC